MRSVDDDSNNSPPARTAVGNGALTYDMDIEAGHLGGITEVTMTPNFGFPGISARYVLLSIPTFPFCLERLLIDLFRITSCKVSSGVHELYPIHNFQNDVCFDISSKDFESY